MNGIGPRAGTPGPTKDGLHDQQRIRPVTPILYRPAGGDVTAGTHFPADDPAGDLTAAVDADALARVPVWHTSLVGGPHITPDAVERYAADRIYLRRIGRLEAS